MLLNARHVRLVNFGDRIHDAAARNEDDGRNVELQRALVPVLDDADNFVAFRPEAVANHEALGERLLRRVDAQGGQDSACDHDRHGVVLLLRVGRIGGDLDAVIR